VTGGARATWRHADGREEPGRVRVCTLGLDWQPDGGGTRQLDPRRLGAVDAHGERLHVELRGRTPDEPGATLLVDDVALLAPLLELRAARTRPAPEAAVPVQPVATRDTPHPALLLVPVVVLALLAGGWLLVEQLWRFVPVDIERSLGELAHAELVSEDDRVHAPELQAELEAMLRALAEDGADLQLDIVRRAEPNAFALPGGFVVVHTGLFRHAPSPDALAGVLAHELVHVEQHHGLRQLIRSLGLWVGLSAVFGSGDLLVAGGRELLELSHSREAEAEADALAVEKLHRAGHSVRGLLEFLRALRAEGQDLPASLDWLSTHPAGARRIERLQAALEREAPGARPWVEDRAAWDAAVARLLGRAPEGSWDDAPR